MGTHRARAAGTALAVLAIGLAGCGGTATRGGGALAPLPLAPSDRAGDAAAELYPARVVEYVLGGELPDLGASARVWRVVAPASAADAAARVADALGVEGEVREFDGGAEVQGADGTVSVYDGGGLYVSWYRGATGGGGGSTGSGGEVPPDAGVRDDVAEEPVTDPPASDPPASEPPPSDPPPSEPPPEPEPVPPVTAPEALPSPEEAEQIARDLLTRAGLLEGADWDGEVFDGGTVGVAVACPTDADCPAADDQTIVTSRSVVLHRVVDGARVAGIEWYVDVGDHGVVQSLSGLWARLADAGDYPLRDVADVYDDLVAGDAWWGGPQPLAEGGATDVGAPADTPVAAPDSAPAGDDPVVEPPTEPEPIRVTVTGASLGTMLVPSYDGGVTGAFVVPSYRFTGTYDDGSEWTAELLALDPAYVSPPDPGVEPQPDPAPEPVPEPGPAPDGDGVPVPEETPTKPAQGDAG
jgi:hypothetical protein